MASTRPHAETGLRMRMLRELNGLTQRQAAQVCKISATAWNDIERGINRPSIETACRACDAWGADLDFIFRGRFSERRSQGKKKPRR